MDRLRYVCFLAVLFVLALLLTGRLVYVFLADKERFPIRIIKVSANYQHITRKQLETILEPHLQSSFFSISMNELQEDLQKLDWTDQVIISRVWPDTLKIMLSEREPIAIWENNYMTADGTLFDEGGVSNDTHLPRLSGPEHEKRNVLQNYQNLSKLLAPSGLQVNALHLRENQAWELSLANGVILRLGKKDIEGRVARFCKAYPALFSDKLDQVMSVDLRYETGMAVQWRPMKLG